MDFTGLFSEENNIFKGKIDGRSLSKKRKKNNLARILWPLKWILSTNLGSTATRQETETRQT